MKLIVFANNEELETYRKNAIERNFMTFRVHIPMGIEKWPRVAFVTEVTNLITLQFIESQEVIRAAEVLSKATQ